MATQRDIRRLAFQALYQLDARAGGPAAAPAPPEAAADDAAAVLVTLLDDADDPHSAAARYTPAEIRKSFALATAAFARRAEADAFMTEAAPTWPAHRQAAVDRAILRLGYHEMTTPGGPHPKIVVNEAIELAKEFSTEKSPAFINGLLDKLLKQVLKEPDTQEPVEGAAESAASKHEPA